MRQLHTQRNSWPDDRVVRLRALYADGLSASQIAAEIGDLTRNAVIGKLHRLGLTGDGEPYRVKVRAARLQLKAKVKVLKVRAPSNGGPVIVESFIYAPNLDLEEFNAAIPEAQRCTLIDLNEEQCHWPVGEIGAPGFFFCGGAVHAEPYCKFHDHIGHAAPPARRGNSPAPARFAGPGRGTAWA